MALSIDELRRLSQQKAQQQDQLKTEMTSRVVTVAKRADDWQSARIASRLDNPISSPSVNAAVKAKQSAQIASRLDNSLINKATQGTTNPAEMYRPGNVTESLFKTPNYISNNAMTEMVDRANARWALQQDNTATKKAREAAKKSAEQQKAAMERMVSDLYQKMEGYKNNGQTDELFKAEQEYAKLNDSIAQMNSKIHGSAMEEAKDWETQRYNEIMSTGGRVLLANLERLAELSDNRIKEADDERRNGLTETETEYYDLYNNLKSKYGDQVDGWLEYAKRMGNKSKMAMSTAKARQAAENSPFWSSVGSVPLNMASGVGYLDAAGQKMQRAITGSDTPIDYNSPAQTASKMTGTIRDTVSEDMNGVGKFLYNTGMSMADTLAAMPMGNFGMAMLGGSAATNAMQTAIERGASDEQALTVGLVAGAMETVMEKASIDSLFKLKTPEAAKDVILNILKQAGAEGTEEGLTTLSNTLADHIIMGDKSELNAAKRAYMAEGYSADKAEGMALKDWGLGLLTDIAGGALSGGVFGSVKSGFDVIRSGGFQKPTVESVMPKPKQEAQPTALQTAAHPAVPVQPTIRSANMDKVGRVMPNVRKVRTETTTGNTLAVGDRVKAKDRGNYGQIVRVNGDGTYQVSFKAKSGATATKTFSAPELEVIKRSPSKASGANESLYASKKTYINDPMGEAEEYSEPEVTGYAMRVAEHLNSQTGKYPTYGDWTVYRTRDSQGDGATLSIRNRKTGEKFSRRVEGGRYITNSQMNHMAAQMLETHVGGKADAQPAMGEVGDMGAKTSDFRHEVKKSQTHGHRTLGGTEFPPNQAYIEAKRKIAGAKPIQQQTETEVEELPIIPGYGEVQDAQPAMGAADSGFDPYSHASLEYGAIEPGENPARVVDVPKSMDGESNVMQTVRTIMEADATPDAAIPGLEQAVVKGKFSKMPITDQAASERAEATIRRVGYQQALADWRAEVRNGKVSKDSVVVGETLYNAAVNAGDMKSAVKIAVELSTQVRSAAQALQAVRMLKKMSPAAQLYGVKQSVDNLQKTLTDRYGDRAPNLVINKELAAKFLQAETDVDRKTAEEALYKDIAKQIPATFADKWNAWRYLSMLGNPRTHIRNIAGNAMFAPVRFAKNKLGAAMEAGAQAVGLIDKSQRTKAFGAVGKDLMAAAKADYANVEQQILGGEKYNSSSNIIEENRQIFEPRVAKAAGKAVKKLTGADIPKWVENISIEGLRKGNSKLLELEDSVFSKGAYASSLASYLKAQGFTAADFTGNGMTAQQKDAARAYAIKEAQKATYRDINGFSEAISSIGFKKPGDSKTKHVLNSAIEGVMPFKKTPANILVRSVEYSPAGLAKAITTDVYAVARGEITAGEYMDRLASGLTGTGLFALGWFLSNSGLLVGGTPEDEDQAELEGRQPYSLEIGGKSITLDWLAPEAMPVFMGVELAEAIREGGGDASLTDKVLSFVKGLSGPMLEMSMMSSLQEALEATEYADNKLLAFMANGALGYLKQAQPTLFGQLERALESSVRQTTFTQEGDKFLNKDAQYMVGSVANKIPFYDYNQVPYIDAWGRTEDLGNTGTRLFNNMLNPAYVSDIQETPVDAEIKRLEDALGVNLTPSRAEKTLTINKEKIILTADEYITYAQAKGQNDLTFRQNLIDSNLYAALDDATKAVAMEKSKDFANALAIREAGFEPNMPGWQKELIDADAATITNVLIAKALESQAGTIDKQEGKEDKTQQDYFADLIDDLNASSAEKRQFWVNAGYAKSTCPY